MTPNEHATPATSANKELAARMWNILDRAPQRQKIPDQVAVDWIEAVIALEKDRAIWHAHRVFGIGGSEIGELINTAAGLPNEYNTLDEISRSKLLLLPPGRANIHMRRGTAMELLAQKVYHRLSGNKSILDSPDIEAAFSKPHEKYPFVVGNPDDVVLTPHHKRLIVDFKVRGNLDPEKPVKLVNAAQVHWYGVLHEGNLGALPDGYQIAELDIPTAMIDQIMNEKDPDLDALADHIAAINRPGFGMQIRTFKHNEKLATHMLRLADQFWTNHVLSGTPYETPKIELPETLTQNDQATIKHHQNQYLRFKLAETVSKSKADEAKTALTDVASTYDLKEWPFETEGLSTGITKRFDVTRAAEHLIVKGATKESLQKASEKPNPEAMMRTLEAHGLLSPAHFLKDYDPKLVKAALKELGISESDFAVKTVRMGISTKKSDAEVRMLLEAEMESYIADFSPGGQTPNDNLDDLNTPINDDLLDDDSPDSLSLA